MIKAFIFVILLLTNSVCFSEISYTVIHENDKLKIRGQFPNTQGLLEIPNEIWGTNAGEQIQNIFLKKSSTMVLT